VAIKLKRAVISMQCAIRKKSARKQLLELRREAKDVGNLKEQLDKLKV
jgi:hypothetical protein